MPKKVQVDMQLLTRLHNDGKGLSYEQLAIKFNTSKATIKRRFRTTKNQDNPKDPEVMSFAAKLEKLLAEVPTGACRRELVRCVATIRTKHAIGKDEKKRLILNSLSSGACELEEICEDSGLERQETEQLLEELISENKVLRKPRGGVYNRGRKMKFHFFIIY